MVCSFWSSFCCHGTIFALNFSMFKSSVIIFQTVLFHDQLTCDHLNSQLMITIHHLPYPLDVDLSPACWRPPTLFMPLFKPLVPLKNTCVQYSVIFIHLLKHFKCLWWNFTQLEQRFQVYLLLYVYRSIFSVIVGQPAKEVYTKAYEIYSEDFILVDNTIC